MTGPGRYARRTDANQGDIVTVLRKIGVEVVDLSGVGNGVPDLCCFWRGQTVWIEIKDGSQFASRRKLTVEQIRFHNAALTAGVTVHVAKSVPEALAIFGGRVQ